jgi:hypothetical protein
MEITCNRCHQAILAENCYCPACGLPQLVYTVDDAAGQDQPERWQEATRDASMVDWKPAMRAALMLAVPAGLLSSGLSPVGVLGLFWMAAAAAWAVALYLRTQRPAWITIGALFVDRFVLHQSSQIDTEWKNRVDQSQQMTQQLASQMGVSDAAEAEVQKAWMLSPWGHAGIEVFGFASNCLFLLFFAAGGGALGARLMVRNRRPEV